MVTFLASSALVRGFEPRLGQIKDYKIDFCCFSAKHAALMNKSKDWFAQDQDHVSEWSDMFTQDQDNVSEWSDMFTQDQDNVSEWSDMFTQDQDNVSEWSNMFTHGLLFQ